MKKRFRRGLIVISVGSLVVVACGYAGWLDSGPSSLAALVGISAWALYRVLDLFARFRPASTSSHSESDGDSELDDPKEGENGLVDASDRPGLD